MTITLPALRTHIRSMLGDDLSARYSNSHIDEAIRRALADLSNVFPNITSGSITITSAGRDQDISALSGLRTILTLRFPYDPAGDPETQTHDDFYFYTSSGSPRVTIQKSAVPQVGQVIHFTYTTPQSIESLDLAPLSTIPDAYIALLATGAAAYAAIFRSTSVSEAFGSRASDMNQLLSWGNQLMFNFRGMLADLRLSPLTQQRLPGQWRLDQWDT